ncbi:NAD(P)/FAD-dependent oxidoreductase [Streptomyces beijiangensis]|uniref:Tryptophan 7-halogenase n=2 Tax=Streptomyces beijiangensis TaxID=163361 RepID=A0A939JLI9_9ACTN|nr:tryptophan 7-halogenase [Streptomyces beijiangensis]MBO0516455.1 tryptophan 7-halogenase [Streptomyces beijiangensis]
MPGTTPPYELPPLKGQYDVAILGAGIAGSLLGAVLARNGVRVLLADAGVHPRFAIGESTIPYTSALLRLIAARYDVPEIRQLSTFKDIRDNVSRNCGWKKNFGFVYHREDRKQHPGEANQLVLPTVLQTETHLFRQDVDAFMYNVALKYGADGRTGLKIADIDIDGGTGVVLRSEAGEEFHAEYLVDASGFRSPVAEKLSLREEPTRARTHSRSMFTHMIGVTPYDETESGALHHQPSRWHDGTLHHVFDGGWLWVIPFDNHKDSLNPLCSVGLTLDPRKHPATDASPQEEFDSFLSRFPDIARQFEGARPARPWTSTGRLQYSSKQVVGDRFCLTSHASGFIDPLYSRGLTNSFEVINVLAYRLIEASQDGDWSLERFQYVEDLQQGLFDVHDDLVYTSFVAFRDYDLWNAVFRTWALSTVLAALTLENAYFAFAGHGEDSVFRDLEQTRYPGSPFPISDNYNTLRTTTLQLCQAVEDGSLEAKTAATRLFQTLQEADYVPPAFAMGDPDERFVHITPPKMAKAARWAGSDAPEEVGGLLHGAMSGLVKERLRGLIQRSN